MNEPLPLIEKGKYDLEPKLHWLKKKASPTKTPRLNLKPEDAITWYENNVEPKKKQEKEQQEPSEHKCTPVFGKSKISRCQVCGLVMDKNYRNAGEITPLNFLYPDPVLNKEDPRGVHMQTIARPSNSSDMRDFLMYVMGTKGKSINEVYRKHGNLPQSLQKYLTTRIERQLGGNDLLRFDSNFESGNLGRVYCVAEDEYDLYLNVDTNTKGHSQWFFFSAACTEAPGKINFHIKNCCKWESVYGNGMKLSIFSVQDNKAKKIGWTFGGENITYTKNAMKRDGFILNNTTTGGNNAEDSDQELDEELGRESFKPTPGEPNSDFQSLEPSGFNTQRTESNPFDSPTFRNRLAIKTTTGAQTIVNANTGNMSTKNQNQNNNNQNQQVKKRRFYYYTLSFSYNFTNHNDVVYFAYMKPYTFTNLIQLFMEIESELQGESNANSTTDLSKMSRASSTRDNEPNGFHTIEINTPAICYKREKIGNTISGVPLFMITITGNDNPKKMKRKKGVFLTARVHPGEVNSSFVMQGIIKYLVGKTEPAKSLRDFYVFKIIPMLNPEGVEAGNNRTNPSGSDLNRKWSEPNEKLHPCIFSAKQALAEFRQEREIMVFCDIHGHSAKKNAFIYGCNTAADGGFCSWTKVRLFPRIFAKRSHYFSFNDCCFRVTPDKAGTARITVWKEFKVTNSFTLEVSLWGYDYGDQVVQFTDTKLEELGTHFLLSLWEYSYVWATLTQELVLTGGWLKPSKLVELSGTPAQQILSIKLKEEKEERKRKERIQRMEAKRAEIANKNKKKRRPGLNSNLSTSTQLEIQTSRDTSDPVSLTKNFEQHFGYLFNKSNNTNDNNQGNTNSTVVQSMPVTRESNKSKSKNSKNPSEALDTEGNNAITSMTEDSEQISPIKTIDYNDPEGKELDPKQENDESLDKEEMSFVEAISRNRGSLVGAVPDIKEDWREYFDDKELDQNYQMILNGKDPNDLEEDAPDTESERSDYSLDREEFEKVFPRDSRMSPKKPLRTKPLSFMKHFQKPQQPKERDTYITITKLNTSIDMKKKKQLPPIVGMNVKRSTPLPIRKSQNESLKLSLRAALSMCVEKKHENEIDAIKEKDLDRFRDLRKRRLAMKPLESQRRSIEREREKMAGGQLEELMNKHPLPNIQLEVNGDSIENTYRNRDKSQDSLDPEEYHLDSVHSSVPKMTDLTFDRYHLDQKLRAIKQDELFRHKRLDNVKGRRPFNESLDYSGIRLYGNNVNVLVSHKDKRSIEIYATYKKSRETSRDPQFDDSRVNARPAQKQLDEPTFGGKIFSRLSKQIFMKVNNKKSSHVNHLNLSNII